MSKELSLGLSYVAWVASLVYWMGSWLFEDKMFPGVLVGMLFTFTLTIIIELRKELSVLQSMVKSLSQGLINENTSASS